MSSRESGFTLVELLIVIVILGILASLAYSGMTLFRERAIVSSMRSDLRHVFSAQEAYLMDNGSYARSFEDLVRYVSSSNSAEIVIDEASEVSWTATATHPEVTKVCRASVSATTVTKPYCESA